MCGQENAVGMRLRFEVGGGEAWTSWRVARRFQGLEGVLHGGLVLALLDDALWYAAFGRGGFTMTAEARVRYRDKVAVGDQVSVRGRVLAHHGRLWTCAGELVRAASGEVLATAEGKYLELPVDQAEELRQRAQVHEDPA